MAFIGTESVADFVTTTWTSPTKNVDRYDTITGSVFADQAGALHVDQSGDGTHWDVDDSIAVSASTGTKINIPLLLPFVRLRFVATTTAPATFRVYGHLVAAGDS